VPLDLEVDDKRPVRDYVALMRSLLGRVRPLDIAIAVALVAALELEALTEDLGRTSVAVTAFAVLGVAVAFRRAAPLGALVVGLAALLAAVGAGMSMKTPVSPLLFYVLVLYAVALREEWRRAVAGLVVALGATFASLVVAHLHGEAFDWTDVPFVTLISATPWVVGRAMRGRLDESGVLEERVERLERERLTAVADERARIARELHDVIAHSVSVMVVQAGAAEEVLRRDPARAVEPIRAVQDSGRQALVEMTRLLGLLRDDGAELGLAPQPGLDALPTLVAQVEEAGLAVRLRAEGERRTLPPAIELTAYRLLQEALTNALKHAGSARVDVLLRYAADALEIEVLDDGDGGGSGHAGGHGLVGMRERVSVFRGEFDAGPRPEGGFAVRALLPLEAAAP
jgi:signal transduction histidine kinase